MARLNVVTLIFVYATCKQKWYLPPWVELPFTAGIEDVFGVKLDVRFRIKTSVSLFPSCCQDPEYWEFVALEKSMGDSDDRFSPASFEDVRLL